MLAFVSLWSADLLALGEAVDGVAEVADAFHIDVFDGHNAPELLFFAPTSSPLYASARTSRSTCTSTSPTPTIGSVALSTPAPTW